MRIEKTVLLVDDDKEDLEMLEEALEIIDRNHTTIQAKDGVEGLQTLDTLLKQDRLPCLIVLDINMPRMDGRQTFVAIKSDKNLCHIPIVIFSTSNSLLDKTFFEKQNTGYFVKPVNFTALTIAASRMINACYHRTSKDEELK